MEMALSLECQGDVTQKGCRKDIVRRARAGTGTVAFHIWGCLPLEGSILDLGLR